MKLLTKKSLKSFSKKAKKYETPLLLALAGLALIGVGLSISKLSNENKLPQFISADSSSEKPSVDISGAVNKPGVYTLESGAKVADALELAGGFSEKADSEAVSKTINLAAKVTDGQKIYIPEKGVVSGSTSSEGKININSASLKELDTLEGIGTVRAQKIIDNRPYANVNELVKKKVLGEGTFGKIQDQISVF